MFPKKIPALLLTGACLAGLSLPAAAVSVDSGAVYCFSPADFSQDETLSGVCITRVPGEGAVLLGSRQVVAGDILTADQLSMLTFAPETFEEDREAAVEYLPIYPHSVGQAAAVTISVRGREDKAPVAEDLAVETYKNLPLTGRLKVSDPEGTHLSITLTRHPRRGVVTVSEDGSFTYVPKKNKVGVDSFTFTATDEAGKVSREATVTVTILKPGDQAPYQDTAGLSCSFAAEWMKHTGIFQGETVAEQLCFSPERTVTRGEFLTMLVRALELEVEEDAAFTGFDEPVPQWLRPYLAAALRSGLAAYLPDRETFGAGEVITRAQAAALAAGASEGEAVAVWAGEDGPLTRADAALLLYGLVKGR